MLHNLTRTAADPDVVAIAYLMHLKAPWPVIAGAVTSHARNSGRKGDDVQEEAAAYARHLANGDSRRLTGLAGAGDPCEVAKSEYRRASGNQGHMRG